MTGIVLFIVAWLAVAIILLVVQVALLWRLVTAMDRLTVAVEAVEPDGDDPEREVIPFKPRVA